jgi:transposase
MDFHLDRLLNLPDLRIEKCLDTESEVHLTVKSWKESENCPCCGLETDRINQERPLRVRDVSIFGKFTYLYFKRRQFYCENCQKYWTEPLEYIDFKRQTTQRYQEYIYKRVKVSTVSEVAREEELTYDRVQSIFENQFLKKKVCESPLLRISLDEFSHRKGRGNFATVVSDLDKSNLLEVIDSHESEEIKKALLEWSLELREQVEEVSVDMWGGFPKIIKEIFPNARIVIDRFHVMKKINEELNSIRKTLNKSLKRLKIKNLKYYLMKNGLSLTIEEKEILKRILNCSSRLKRAYELKEKFRAIYQTYQTPEEALVQFKLWLKKARNLYRESIGTVQNHLEGICNYFVNRTTSGVMEGINNRIKLIKRQAYGFTNFEHLRIRLLACFSH